MKEDTGIDLAAYHAAIKEVYKIEEEHGITRDNKIEDADPEPTNTPSE